VLSKEIAYLAETILTGKPLRHFLGEWVESKDFADVRGLSPQTVRSMVRRGQLPPQERLPGNRRAWRAEVIFPFFVEK
jgi:hypothetical protein